MKKMSEKRPKPQGHKDIYRKSTKKETINAKNYL